MNVKSRFIIILIVFIFSLLVALPSSWKTSAFQSIGLEKTPVAQFFINQAPTLGLDLQGGTQLDYKVDLKDVPTKDKSGVMDGVTAVFERRVNGLGVSEPNIYQSTVGDEEHIIVELAGIQDINEAKKIIGKVIQLEFKEQNDAQENEQKEKIRLQASDTLKSVVNMPENFEITGKESILKDRVEYSTFSSYRDEIADPFKGKLETLGAQQVYPELIEGSIAATYEIVEGELQAVPEKRGYFILKSVQQEKSLRPDPKNTKEFNLVAQEVSNDPVVNLGYVRKTTLPLSVQDTVFNLSQTYISDVLESDNGYMIYKMEERLPKDQEMVHLQQIVLNYKPIKEVKTIPETATAEEKKKIEEENSAIQKENDIANNYNQKELPTIAQNLAQQAKSSPDQFEALVAQHSEDITSKEKKGDIGFIGKDSSIVPTEVTTQALTLKQQDISSEIKTSKGYYIVKALDKKSALEEMGKIQQIRICYQGTSNCSVSITKEEAKQKADETLKTLREETKYTYEYIYYSTLPDMWKPALALNPITKEKEALTGKFFKRADVEYNSSTMEPIVSITFTEEGGKMFEELTGQLVGKQLAIFVGGDLISAPNVKDKISGGSATITGNFTAEEAGKLAKDLNAGAIPAPITLVGEQQIGAQLGTEALNASLKAGLWGIIVLMLFMILYYRLPGFVASIALAIYVVVFMAFVTIWPGMVLTLAGIAAAILSIGMAVDANILIFERLKEEMRAGKNIHASLKAGFDRAWASIRDSNTSSFLTAFILIWFGSSIIKGFAVMLIVGVVLSLFSAIFVTRTLLQLFTTERFMKKPCLWGVNKKDMESTEIK